MEEKDEVQKILDEVRNNSKKENKKTDNKVLNTDEKNVENFSDNSEDEEFESNKTADESHKEKSDEVLDNLSYSLTEEEALTCLKNSGIVKTIGKRAVVYTVLMAMACVGFVVSYFFQKDINAIVFAVVALLVIAVLWVFPSIHLHRLAKIKSDGKIIKAKIFKDRIEISGNSDDWTIWLDNTNEFKIIKDIFLFHTTKSSQFFVIPKRVINEEKYDEILEIIKDGTEDF